jgi:hypothetical protein
MIMALVFSLILLAFGQKCHALSDYAGQGKAPLTWDELMQPRVDPSRYFATPGGGHGVHQPGGYSAPQAVAKAKADKPAAPEVKPDVKPPMPHIPMVKPPKPEVKPEPHKCLPFHLRPVKHDCTPKAKPDCKHETAKPDKKPSCSKVGDHKKSECAKPAGDKTGCKAPGMKGHGLGHRGGHHGKGKGRK